MTFAERKAARIANQGKKFKFNVVASFPFDGEIVGSFSSRPAAEKFAFEQRGPVVGNTAARTALSNKLPRNTAITMSVYFTIERVEHI